MGYLTDNTKCQSKMEFLRYTITKYDHKKHANAADDLPPYLSNWC